MRAQNTPGARDHLGLAYDTDRNRVVLFGGNDVDADAAYVWNPTTWEWDGSVWTLVDDGTPGSVSSHSMVFDGASGSVLWMGGVSPERGDLDETWMWDGTDWTEHTTSTPGTRMSSGLAYDPVREAVVLYSGCVGRDYPQDTWVFRDGLWSLAAESGPPGVCRSVLFHDAVRGSVVLFGGALDSGGYTSAMWEWDGESWSEIDQGDVRPSPRANIAAAYDSYRRRLVLYGGKTDEGVSDELWEWDGSKWYRIEPTGEWPMPREVHGMTYHAGLGVVLMYGGRTGFAEPIGDFWSWDGTGWERLH